MNSHILRHTFRIDNIDKPFEKIFSHKHAHTSIHTQPHFQKYQNYEKN